MKNVYVQHNDESDLIMYYSSRSNAIKSLVCSLKSYCEDLLEVEVEIDKSSKYTTYVTVTDKKSDKSYNGRVTVECVH